MRSSSDVGRQWSKNGLGGMLLHYVDVHRMMMNIHGYSLNLGACVLVWILIAAQVKYIYWENARRDRGERDSSHWENSSRDRAIRCEAFWI
ncbi:hypothetical protein M422DRAFT_36339 [Sphaerobolus stellatus SS14]|uniref:Unplaced genomic scaffold SPHSTscaffold_172, whole genome shotgun sequence n=1 Tax=Sphaerobolus stellatus (strain SS14) TaxID=990650 RepID=A0A0C9TMH4_SPHS4|nr:hypothetical protein M422DRAFT_36339 [Sphaerobolus stellatus SS14]